MDTLGLRVVTLNNAYDEVQIEVNGRDLVEILREAELPLVYADKPPFALKNSLTSGLAGSYMGIRRELFPEDRFMGSPDGVFVEVLACGGCGEIDCWPFVVKITRQTDRIVWNDYAQPHRRHWKYDALAPFVFDAKEYEATLDSIRRGEATTRTDA